MDLVEITAGRLHLRPWTPQDVPALFAACQDPEIPRWTTVPSPYTLEHARDWACVSSVALWEAGTGAPFAVLDALTGGLLASVGLHAIDGGQAVLGYWAAPEARGHGVVSDATGVVCRWGFEALGLDRIGWEAEVGNWASRAVAQKNGFTMEGTRRRSLPHAGGWVDGWCGSLLREDPMIDRRPLPSSALLTDGVVALRRWLPTDAADVVRACDDPLTARWLGVCSPYTLADATQLLEQTVPLGWATGEVASFAVVDPGTGALLGAAWLKLRRRDLGLAEVSYWTAPWARGRGVAGRAAALVADWGLRELGVSRVELVADVDNAASQRAADRAGFVREGVTFRSRRDRDGLARDMVLFSRV